MKTASLIHAANPELLKHVLRLVAAVAKEPQDARYQTSPRAYLVGGFVRDALLGAHPKDADVEVYGVAPERLEELALELYGEAAVSAVGKSFGVLKVHLAHDVEFDVSLPRREVKKARGHAGFKIDSDPGMSLEDATQRRDFTINAILADAEIGELVDPFGGARDLAARVLRVVDAEHFAEDPLRVYRAMQFVARLGLTVESASLELMRGMVESGELDELSPERVTDEWKKLLLKAEKPSVGLEFARHVGIIEKYYPELHALIGVEQEREWHPEGDVWSHELMVIDWAARIIREEARGLSESEKLQVMVGALCHDLGKPATTAFVDGRIRSRGHEEAGEEPTRALCRRHAFGEVVEHAAVVIATDHLKPGMLHIALGKGKMSEEQYANAVRKIVKRIRPMTWRAYIAAAEADWRGRAMPEVQSEPYPAGDKFTSTILALGLDKEPSKPLVQGRDLIELFGMEPGPEMGRVIAAVEEARDRGTIKTREDALEWLKKRVS